MEIDFLVKVTALGLFAGAIGTGGGGLVALSFGRPDQRFLSMILGFSAGVMLSVIFLELFQEAIGVGGFWPGLLGLAAGIAVIWLLDQAFPRLHFTFRSGEQGRFYKAGILLGIGIALHNVPEGLAIGAGYVSEAELGTDLAVVMAVQNFPEGIAMATTLLLGGACRWKIIVATVLAGLPMGVGAWAGGVIGSISPFFLSLSLGFAGGAMLYIVCDELIPDAHVLANSRGGLATLGISAGVLVGLLLGKL